MLSVMSSSVLRLPLLVWFSIITFFLLIIWILCNKLTSIQLEEYIAFFQCNRRIFFPKKFLTTDYYHMRGLNQLDTSQEACSCPWLIAQNGILLLEYGLCSQRSSNWIPYGTLFIEMFWRTSKGTNFVTLKCFPLMSF